MKEIAIRAVYKCDFCEKKHWLKGVISRHEKNCSHNPANVDACIMCKHMVIGEKTVQRNLRYDQASYSKTCKSFTCSKLNKELYPFIAERKKLPSRYPETFEGLERMPTICEHYEVESFDSSFSMTEY